MLFFLLKYIRLVIIYILKREDIMSQRTKGEIQLIYKAMYGQGCLETSLYYDYKKRDYESAIDDYRELEKLWDQKLFEETKKRRTMREINVLKALDRFI